MAKPCVRVRIFATLRELAGTSEVLFELEGQTSVEECWGRLCQLHPVLSSQRESVRPALNLVWCEWSAKVRAGDELAFLPPVSGGSTVSALPVEVRLGPEPIDLAELQAGIERVGIGAIATFVGLVRDPDEGEAVPFLDYEAYPEMARSEIGEIAEEARGRFGATQVAVQHRLGRVASGVASVAVVVGAPHRQQALRACGFVIDELKSKAPIWKSPGPASGD